MLTFTSHKSHLLISPASACLRPIHHVTLFFLVLSLQLFLYCADAAAKQGFRPRTRADLNAMSVAQLNAAIVAYTGAQAFAGRKEEKVDFLYHLLGGQRFLVGQRP